MTVSKNKQKKLKIKIDDSVCPHLVYVIAHLLWSYSIQHLYSFIKCKLFIQYCCNFDGSNLWLVTCKRCCDICVAWQLCQMYGPCMKESSVFKGMGHVPNIFMSFDKFCF